MYGHFLVQFRNKESFFFFNLLIKVGVKLLNYLILVLYPYVIMLITKKNSLQNTYFYKKTNRLIKKIFNIIYKWY